MSQPSCLELNEDVGQDTETSIETPPPPSRTGADTVTDLQVGEACPKCGGKLTSPGDLGWCSKCGYCKSLEQETKHFQAAGNGKKPSPLGVLEFMEIARETPKWVWVLLGGFGFLLALSAAADWLLPTEPNLFRAVWTTAQVVIGLASILVAQIWAAILISYTTDMELGPKDFIFSFHVWGTAFKQVPYTRKPVTLLAWALTAIMSGFIMVGGLEYYWEIYKPKKVAGTSLREAIGRAAREGGAGSLEDALQDFANSQDLTKDKDPNKKDQDKEDIRGTVQCVVIGYVIEGDHLAGLVLAMEVEGRLKYAGTVRTGFSEDEAKELLKALSKIEQPLSLLPGLSTPGAVWVKPDVLCEVHQSGMGTDGTLIKPNYKGLLK